MLLELFGSHINTKITLLLICVLLYITYKLTFWRRQQISNQIFHIFDLFRYPIHLADQKLIQKCGPIVGSYEILNPNILIAEPSLIKRVLNANHRDFFDHRTYILAHHNGGQSLLFLKYDSWKIKRAIISPAFKTKHMRQMFPIFDEAANSLIFNMGLVPDEQVVNMKPYFLTYMFDVILRAFFGTEIDSVNYTNNPLIEHIEKVLAHDFTLKQVIGIMNPTIAKLFDIEMINRNAVDFLADLSSKLIDERKNIQNKKEDFIQYLIDAEIDFPDDTIKKSLTKKEIIDNCILFFIAGIDTTTNTLVHLTYALVRNPEIQQKLLNEINHFCDNQEINYDLIKKLTYLDACIKETLRYWPPGSRIERICKDDIQLDHIFIPKDSIVIIPLYSVHHDPDNFENPDSFIPDRFLPENIHLVKPGTYFPFGDGPRFCIGNRFAELAMKICAIKMLRKFKLVESERTHPIHHYKGMAFMSPEKLLVKLIKR